jgi:hypothetical protein
MALFKRREPAPPQSALSSSSSSANEYIGRRFESASAIDICLQTYAEVLPQLYPVDGPAVSVDWVEPLIPPGWESTQFKRPMSRPPDRVLGNRLRGGGMIYLAVWDNGEDRLNNLWFVPPGFDHTEVGAIGGAWFSALKSAGHNPVVSDGLVERAEWGAGS